MKNDTYIIIGVIMVLAGALIYSLMGLIQMNPTVSDISPQVHEKNPQIVKSPSGDGFSTQSSGSLDSGDVQIDLTPLEFKDGKLRVDFRANTHTVDMNGLDLKGITVLEIAGREVSPSSAPVLSGHHVSGIMEFVVGSSTKEFTITIKGIPAEDERKYSWR